MLRHAHDTSGTTWRLHHWVREIWEEVLADCAGATESIDFEQYILTPDTIGNRLLGELADKARQGVRVRLLCDAFGSSALRGSAPVRRLEAASGTIQFYNRPMVRQFLHLPPRLHRDHRKSIVIDGHTGWLGGACFTDRMADWRDTMLRLQGYPVETMAAFFETAWKRAAQQRTHREQRRAPPEFAFSQDGPFRYLVNSPERPAHRALYEVLRERIRAARRSIRLVTPYFAPDHVFLRELTAAAQRGVRVDLVLPGISDYPSVDLISHSFADRLARRGGAVHFFKPVVMHAKLAAIDREWAAVGSLNLDRLSFRINLENALASGDPAFVAAIDDRIDEDIVLSDTERPALPRWTALADPLVKAAVRFL